VLRGSDVRAELRGNTYGDEHDWMSRGLSAIVAPGGEILAGPLAEEENILYATIDPDLAQAHRRHFDALGHHSRPDVFNLRVDTTRRQPVTLHRSQDDR
jgi:nitrilase